MRKEEQLISVSWNLNCHILRTPCQTAICLSSQLPGFPKLPCLCLSIFKHMVLSLSLSLPQKSHNIHPSNVTPFFFKRLTFEFPINSLSPRVLGSYYCKANIIIQTQLFTVHFNSLVSLSCLSSSWPHYKISLTHRNLSLFPTNLSPLKPLLHLFQTMDSQW